MEQTRSGIYAKGSSNLESSSSNTVENGKSSSKNEKQLSDEQRISFLNQCKLELSAEVIRWKEECVRQAKEKEALSQKVEELQLFANNLASKNHELETSLFLSWEENKRLRVQSHAIGEENSALQEKLSKTRFHSYPWFDMKASPTTAVECNHNRDDSGEEETLQEVSRKLLLQMQKEMKEMEQLSRTLAEREKIIERVENVIFPNTQNEEGFLSIESAAVKKQISGIASETEVLQNKLELQNEKLKFLLNQIVKGSERKKKVISSNLKQPAAAVALRNSTEPVASNAFNEENHSRPSDETFRAYFTQQLTKNAATDKKVTQVYVNREDSFGYSNQEGQKPGHGLTNQQYINGQKLTSSQIDPRKSSRSASTDDKRLCPICEIAFPKTVPDQEFEAHVIEHLDAVSATLLDQYDMA